MAAAANADDVEQLGPALIKPSQQHPHLHRSATRWHYRGSHVNSAQTEMQILTKGSNGLTQKISPYHGRISATV